MSSLNLAVNPSNNLQAVEVDSNGNLKVNVAASASTHTQNVDIVANTIGLATETTLSAAEVHLGAIDTATGILSGAVVAGAVQVDISSDSAGLATSALQTSGNTSLATLAGAVAGSEVQVDVITSALPSGAATESTLSAAEAHLGTIDTSTATASTTLTGISAKLPATLGQDVMADSLSVVIASNQSSIPVSTAGGSTTNSIDNLTPSAGATATSTAADMNGSNHLTIFGNSNNTTDTIFVETSADNSTFYKNPEHFVNQNFSTGDFAVNIVSPAARYYRISQGNTTGSGKTLAINTSKK